MEARVVDFDGTLTNHNRTVLEQLALDYLETRPRDYYKLIIRGTIVSYFTKLHKSFLDKFKRSPYFTGETTNLNAFDFLFLRKAEIPESFMKERAREYAEYIPKDVRKSIRQSKHHVYIISSEPVQLLENILLEADVLDSITEVRGNKFKMYDGIIEGFNRVQLLGGSRGKYFRISDLPKKYEIVRTLGDDKSDIGLFRYLRDGAGTNIIPYALSTAPLELKQLVGEKGVLDSVVEFL